jgi:hypothetical protein
MPDADDPDQQAHERDGPIEEGDGISRRPSQEDIAAGGKPDDKSNNEPKNRFNFKVVAELSLGFVIAIATVINVCVAYRQWSAMTENNSIARESFASVQRAFISIASFDTPIRMSQIPGATQQFKYWWFIPNIKNSGNTPTKNMRYFVIATCPSILQFALGPKQAMDCDFTRHGEPIDPEDVLKRAPNKPVPAIIGPQATAQIGWVWHQLNQPNIAMELVS